MSFLFLILSFLLLVFSRQILISLFFTTIGFRLARTFYFLIFLPGVIIHEFSHLFIAILLLVPTGEISIFPEEEKMGFVKVAKTDPIRQALIGLAPTFMGTAVILAIFRFANLENLIWYYLIFVINNTMFTSKSDRQSWIGLVALIGLMAGLLYLLGLWPLIIGPLLNYATLAAKFITQTYFSTFLINLVFIVPLFVFQKIIEKIASI